MARITVEQCLKKIPNRFELVHVAARRARELLSGGMPQVEFSDDDSPIVVALREIEAGHVTKDILNDMDSGSLNYESAFSDLANKAEHVTLSTNFEEEESDDNAASPDGETGSTTALEASATVTPDGETGSSPEPEASAVAVPDGDQGQPEDVQAKADSPEASVPAEEATPNLKKDSEPSADDQTSP